VTDPLYTQAQDASDAPRPLTAGATLRSARETAGLSVEDVAAQLKLAPRQVQALEEDEFERLPGRTFARGFARNYARFVQLDPEAVLALMPAAEIAPALERPSFAAARRPMGEIPVERAATRSGAPRALVLLLVLVIVGAAAYYEYSRKAPDARRESTVAAGQAADTSGMLRAPSGAGTGAATTSALPNPVAESPPAPSGNTAATSEATPATTDASAAPATAASTSAAAARTNDASLVLVFKGTSWAEVKDSSGRVILQMTGGGGMTQMVSGAPPLELSLGNAPNVAVTFRGQTLDLAPYTRGVVARVALK
jgi:cytoskeleton protein RodZ